MLVVPPEGRGFQMTTITERRLIVGRSKCKCPLCDGHRRLRAVIRRGDKKEMRQVIRDLSELLCNTSEELEMAKTYIDDLRSGGEK